MPTSDWHQTRAPAGDPANRMPDPIQCPAPDLMIARAPTLLFTGPGGVGKTSVAAEVSELLDAAGVAHAFVDVDSLRWCYPRPPDDRFRTVLAMRNLAAIWPNFRVYGATHLILADVLEARADLARYEAAVPSATITVVRLRAPLETLIARVQQRERGSALDRQIQRVTELAAKMDRDQVEDLLVETDGKSVTTIAREVLGRIGWLPEGLREH